MDLWLTGQKCVSCANSRVVHCAQAHTSSRAVPPTSTVAPMQPAMLEPTSQVPMKSSWEEEELIRKQGELDRKAEELRLREEQLQRNLGFESESS